MGKRKIRKSAAVVEKVNSLASDGEMESERPSKQIKMYQNESPKFRSTPFDRPSMSYNGPSTSYDRPSTSYAVEHTYLVNGNEMLRSHLDHYDNFSSFLHSHSFGNEEEEEDDLLTVSQMAERKSQNPSLNEISQNAPVNLNNSTKVYYRYPSTENIRFFPVSAKQLQVVSLEHPASLTLHGYLKMTVLAGTVSILGYNVKEGQYVHVFSTKRTGYRKITTKDSVHIGSRNHILKKVKKIVEVEKNRVIDDFVDRIGGNTVVVLLEKSFLPPQLQFLELYFPQALEIGKSKRRKDKIKEDDTLSSTDELCAIEINSDAELIAEELKKAIDLAEGTSFGPRVLVHGPKNCGKSTMLRYLINTVLNKHRQVYYLDTDPGQTELTPPGVVSLTKVTQPFLGPAFANQRKTVKMIFTGSVTPNTSPSMYKKSVQNLIEHFYKTYPKEILFVNTMGWIQGIGKVCFDYVKTSLRPTMLLDFLSLEECPQLKIESADYTHIQIPFTEYPKEIPFSSKDLRNFSLMSYFGKLQQYFLQPTYINAFRPACVRWDDIAVSSVGNKVAPNRLIESIHCSVVALCCVEETLMLESENPEFPKTLQDEAINECLGFGLVRATDEANHLLYIITPLSLKKLENVNALIKGNVMIPDEVFLKQPIVDTPLPYTDQSQVAPAFNRRIVKKRQFFPNQTPKKR